MPKKNNDKNYINFPGNYYKIYKGRPIRQPGGGGGAGYGYFQKKTNLPRYFQNRKLTQIFQKKKKKKTYLNINIKKKFAEVCQKKCNSSSKS